MPAVAVGCSGTAWGPFCSTSSTDCLRRHKTCVGHDARAKGHVMAVSGVHMDHWAWHLLSTVQKRQFAPDQVLCAVQESQAVKVAQSGDASAVVATQTSNRGRKSIAGVAARASEQTDTCEFLQTTGETREFWRKTPKLAIIGAITVARSGP